MAPDCPPSEWHWVLSAARRPLRVSSIGVPSVGVSSIGATPQPTLPIEPQCFPPAVPQDPRDPSLPQPLLGTPPKLRAPPGPVPPATVGMALPWPVPSLCCQHHRDHVGAPLPCTPVQQCWSRCPRPPIPPICLMQSPCTRLGVPLPRPGSTPFPHPSAHGSGPPPVLPAFKDPSPFPEIL